MHQDSIGNEEMKVMRIVEDVIDLKVYFSIMHNIEFCFAVIEFCHNVMSINCKNAN